MHKKSIIHILSKARIESSEFVAEIDAMEDLSEKYWIKNVLFYKWDVIKFDSVIKKLEKFHILFKNYSNKEDLKKQVLEFSKKYEVIFVDTPLELLVNTVNKVKEALWRPMSDNPDIFRDKFLQRKLIQDHNPELWIKFIKWSPEKLDINVIETKVWYPFIIKPVDWVQSSGVAKITNKKDFEDYIKSYKDFHDRLKSRWVDNKELIVEEFIDWKLYSIDYYITCDWEIRLAKPVKVRLWIDVKIDDYCNIARIATEKTEWEFKWKRLKTFIKGTAKATWIRNTFVHHEFKINSKWDLKTIELNGRLGGWRLELMKRTYDFNLYELLIDWDVKPGKLKENNIAVNIYATKRWILEWFNEKVLKRIEARESFYASKYNECEIWKEVWLTKDWFIKVWVIKLKHKNYDILSKDFAYIKSKYSDLLHIEWIIKKKRKKIRSIIKSKVAAIFIRRKKS